MRIFTLNRLLFTTNCGSVISNSEFSFICQMFPSSIPIQTDIFLRRKSAPPDSDKLAEAMCDRTVFIILCRFLCHLVIPS